VILYEPVIVMAELKSEYSLELKGG